MFAFCEAYKDFISSCKTERECVTEMVQQAEKAVKILGGKIQDVVYFNLPDSEIQRSLVVIEKMKSTPGRYPRKAGTPLKEPLS